GRGKRKSRGDLDRRNQAAGHCPPVLFFGAGSVSSEGQSSCVCAALLQQGAASGSTGTGAANAPAGTTKVIYAARSSWSADVCMTCARYENSSSLNLSELKRRAWRRAAEASKSAG